MQLLRGGDEAASSSLMPSVHEYRPCGGGYCIAAVASSVKRKKGTKCHDGRKVNVFGNDKFERWWRCILSMDF